ncbi:MAG: HTTM domain-containing protein [Pirellulaceae bacterium]
MNIVLRGARDWVEEGLAGWDRFWFKPALPHTLALIRILAGAMLLYTHFVWSLNLEAFLGPSSWITADVSRELHGNSIWAWTPLWHIESPAMLWTLHLTGLVVIAMFTVGLFSRVTSVLSFLLAVMYCHRLEGALFGLDQVNTMLAMYCMFGPCGAVYSVDRLIRRVRAGGPLPEPEPSVGANVAIRLIQLHMCVIYLFGGIGKIKGDTWWVGNAFWMAVGNKEYQSLDMTWLVHYPVLCSLLAHITVFWETFYCATVWPRWTRPITLAVAAAVHGGIALFLGMITFGLAMLIGNLAFVPPEMIRNLAAWLAGERGRGGEEGVDLERAPPQRARRRGAAVGVNDQ